MQPEELRAAVPLLRRVAYLDSAATSLTPAPVLDAVRRFHEEVGASPDRGAHALGSAATDAWHAARAESARILLRAPADEVVLTRSCTEALNLLAEGLRRCLAPWGPGDVVLTTVFEHHANLLPWQRVCADTGARLAVARPQARDAPLRPEDLLAAAGEGRVRVLALQHASNVTGHLHDVPALVRAVKAAHPGTVAVVDGAQVAGHAPLDAPALGVDAYAFAGHKGPLGPPGTGGAWVRRDLLERLPPLLLGGGIIADVTEQGHALRPEAARRFDAGTPDVAGVVGLAAGARLLLALGLARVARHEASLVARLRDGLASLGADLVGPSEAGVVSFVLPGWGCHDLALALDKEGVAVRSGHHCALPLARWLDTLDGPGGGTVRASFHAYNDATDVDRLIAAAGRLVR